MQFQGFLTHSNITPNSSESKRPEIVLIYQIKWYKTPRDSIQSSLPFSGSHFWPLKVLVHGFASFLTLQSLISDLLEKVRFNFCDFLPKINLFLCENGFRMKNSCFSLQKFRRFCTRKIFIVSDFSRKNTIFEKLVKKYWFHLKND